MRAIILCILISIVSHWAWGQLAGNTSSDGDTLYFGQIEQDTCWQSVSVDTVWTPHEIHMARWYQQFRPLLEVLKFYSDECWADSTNQTFHVYSYGGNEYTSLCPREYGEPCIDPGINPGFRGHRTIYTHREPTFTGFREFLERKVKP